MNAPATTRGISDVRSLLKSPAAFKQIESVAAKHLSGERMARVMANAVRVTPALADCEPMSFLGAMMTAASLGLEPNNGQGHAYLIPFNNRRKIDGKWETIPEAQLIIGYKGYLALAFRSGMLTYVDVGVHYSDDEIWEYEKGTNFKLRHAEGPQEGDKLHAYAIVKWSNPNGDDGTAAVVLPWAKVMSTRDSSQGWKMAVSNGKTDKSPWSTHEDAMAIKTAIRALANGGRMPMSIEMQTAMQIDESRGVDFRSFAADPSLGGPNLVSSKGSADDPDPNDYVEGNAVEERKDDGPKKATHEERKPEPKQAERKTQDRSEPADDKHFQKKQEEPKTRAAEESVDEQWDRLQRAASAIEADLLDVGADGVPKVLDAHKNVITEMQREVPSIWDNIQSLIDDL